MRSRSRRLLAIIVCLVARGDETPTNSPRPTSTLQPSEPTPTRAPSFAPTFLSPAPSQQQQQQQQQPIAPSSSPSLISTNAPSSVPTTSPLGPSSLIPAPSSVSTSTASPSSSGPSLIPAPSSFSSSTASPSSSGPSLIPAPSPIPTIASPSLATKGGAPSIAPSSAPPTTFEDTYSPTGVPSYAPTVGRPSTRPTTQPSYAPTPPSRFPSQVPTTTRMRPTTGQPSSSSTTRALTEPPSLALFYAISVTSSVYLSGIAEASFGADESSAFQKALAGSVDLVLEESDVAIASGGDGKRRRSLRDDANPVGVRFTADVAAQSTSPSDLFESYLAQLSAAVSDGALGASLESSTTNLAEATVAVQRSVSAIAHNSSWEMREATGAPNSASEERKKERQPGLTHADVLAISLVTGVVVFVIATAAWTHYVSSLSSDGEQRRTFTDDNFESAMMYSRTAVRSPKREDDPAGIDKHFSAARQGRRLRRSENDAPRSTAIMKPILPKTDDKASREVDGLVMEFLKEEFSRADERNKNRGKHHHHATL